MTNNYQYQNETNNFDQKTSLENFYLSSLRDSQIKQSNYKYQNLQDQKNSKENFNKPTQFLSELSDAQLYLQELHKSQNPPYIKYALLHFQKMNQKSHTDIEILFDLIDIDRKLRIYKNEFLQFFMSDQYLHIRVTEMRLIFLGIPYKIISEQIDQLKNMNLNILEQEFNYFSKGQKFITKQDFIQEWARNNPNEEYEQKYIEESMEKMVIMDFQMQ